jgi:hypothetical protein
VIYEGNWKNGVPEGHGVIYDGKGKNKPTLFREDMDILTLINPEKLNRG